MLKIKVVPIFSLLEIVIEIDSKSHKRFTIDNPNPVPLISE